MTTRSTQGARRKRLAGVFAMLAVMLAASACEAPPPGQVNTVGLRTHDGVQPTHRDVLYVVGGERGCSGGKSDHTCGGSQELDIYPARSGGNRGVIVYFHGGGFVTGNKAPITGLGNIMSQTQRGFSVVSVNYRLADHEAGNDGFADTMSDVAAALNWVHANDGEYGLSTSTVLVAGGSAGGTLAAMAGTTWNSPQPEFADMPRVHGWIAVSGILDWRSGPMSEAWMQLWTGSAYEERRDLASAINHMDLADPPGYVVHGGLDHFVELSNATNLQAELTRQRLAGESVLDLRINVDVTDRYADGSDMGRADLGHEPMGGANASYMNLWIDSRTLKIADYGS